MGDSGSAYEVGTFSSRADDLHVGETSRADDLHVGEILSVIHSRDSPNTWSTNIHSVG